MPRSFVNGACMGGVRPEEHEDKIRGGGFHPTRARARSGPGAVAVCLTLVVFGMLVGGLGVVSAVVAFRTSYTQHASGCPRYLPTGAALSGTLRLVGHSDPSARTGLRYLTGSVDRIKWPALAVSCCVLLCTILYHKLRFRVWVRTRDPQCRQCGYCLAGITEPRCPECGERL